MIENFHQNLAPLISLNSKNEMADAVHAATCLQSNAVLISNDKHFDKIREMKIIEVWKISKAIEKLLKT